MCGPDALETVAQLVEKSLVVADLLPAPAERGGPQVRYRLLETIHEYAAERAAERPAELAGAMRPPHRLFPRPGPYRGPGTARR